MYMSSGNQIILCYIEDCNGGFLCNSNDKEYFLRNKDKVVCYEGNKSEIEEYLNMKISENMITKADEK